MTTNGRLDKFLTLRELLPPAERHGFAVGSFSPRYPLMIPPVLRAAEDLSSPLIVQISQKDMSRCGVAVAQFARAFFASVSQIGLSVPVTLHLDHTENTAIIEDAVAAGFSSVMIDASDKPFEENIDVTRAVADYGHRWGVSVEGELGTIGAFAFSETAASGNVAYTVPQQVARFVDETRVDALAVSIGSVHGLGAPVTLDTERLKDIRAASRVHLVLHGGSGIEAADMARAIGIPGGGVAKVNLATDLELAMLRALGSESRLVNDQIEALGAGELARAQAAVEAVVRDKMTRVLGSAGQARHYEGIRRPAGAARP